MKDTGKMGIPSPSPKQALGNILQKFRNYGIKVAAILPKEKFNKGKFSEMVAEENRSSEFRVFMDREAAEEWLIKS